jgi:hypothetical protein
MKYVTHGEQSMWTAPTRSLSESTAEPRQMIVSGQHQFGAGLADHIIALPQYASGETAAASYLYRQPRVPRLQGGRPVSGPLGP